MNVLILYEIKSKKGMPTAIKISHCDKMIIDLDKKLIYYGSKRYDLNLIDYWDIMSRITLILLKMFIMLIIKF